MRIQKVEAFPISLPRDFQTATGTAGLPAQLKSGTGAYKWSNTVAAVYSERLETTLVRVTTSEGLIGWGEAQAPVAPRVSAAIVEDILAGVLTGEQFDGTPLGIEALWNLMFRAMRVRGQTGGFMLDAISGVDLALWDLAGKIQGLPVAALIRNSSGAPPLAPAYLSGLSGESIQDKCRFAKSHYEAGFRLVKVFFDKSPAELLELLDALSAALGPEARFAVDALWRLEWPASRGFIEQLAARNIHWLEAPFMPDDWDAHRQLARTMPELPLALGESYRTRQEMSWFLDEGLVRFVQPDLGRSGITESLKISRAGVQLAPHVSIALGPQIAAAVHLSSALSGSTVCEFNPTVFESSNRLLREPLVMEGACYQVPTAPGLGIEFADTVNPPGSVIPS